MTIYDSEKSYVYTLDEISTQIVNMIKKKQSIVKIVYKLTKIYEVEKERANRDVKRLLKELLQKKIVVVV